MNSLTWLLAPRPKSSTSLSKPDSKTQHHRPNADLSRMPSSGLQTIDLGSGPRETEAEMVDKMVDSVERRNGIRAANTLERKASMSLDGELRFGLPGITERRRTLHLEPGSPCHPTQRLQSENLTPSSSSTAKAISTSPSTTDSLKNNRAIRSSLDRYHQLARLLPVRLGVHLYILIRRFLSLFGLHIIILNEPATTTSLEKRPMNQEPRKPLVRSSLSSIWSKFFPSRQKPRHPSQSPHQPQQGGSHSDKRELFAKRSKTLVLDLDETLIHSTSRLGGIGGSKSKSSWAHSSHSSYGGNGVKDLKVRVVEVVLDGRIVVYHVYKRPWVDFFLKTVSSWYTVVIFTASMREYADPVIDWLDQGRGLIDGRLFRESCTNIKGSYVKDLTIVEGDLSKVCLVDNSPISYEMHQANGIPIEGWLNDPTDEGLLELLPMLDSLRFTKDVRRILGLRGFGAQPRVLHAQEQS